MAEGSCHDQICYLGALCKTLAQERYQQSPKPHRESKISWIYLSW